jgi:hypothetical protein
MPKVTEATRHCGLLLADWMCYALLQTMNLPAQSNAISADGQRRHGSRSLTGPVVVAACRRSRLRPTQLNGEEGVITLRGSDIYRWVPISRTPADMGPALEGCRR